jgi:hypothetical protein
MHPDRGREEQQQQSRLSNDSIKELNLYVPMRMDQGRESNSNSSPGLATIGLKS